MTDAYPEPAVRGLITIGCMLATIMVSLDSTIANVALPHMQSSMLASIDQIVWVLTSYMIAGAIATPLSGWLAQRFGRKRIMMASVAGFTLASLACGVSANLEQLVLFRILQGIGGAAIVPLSQATLLDINPPERHGQAMAIYGMGSVLGPVVGPTLGGYLTDAFSWHWIFLINLPVGIMSFLLISAFMTESEGQSSRFDLTGFALLSIAVASTQLMLDRGQQLDWFDSWEIRLETTIACLFAFMTVVHMLLTPDPFIKPALLKDRNFALGSVISLIHGMLIFSVMALMAPMLQHLMGYSAMQTGLVSMPRSVGTMVAMFTVGLMVNRFDERWLVAGGMAIATLAMYCMAHFSLMMDEWTIIWIGFFQGFGAGFVFVPLSTLLFSTLDPRLRNEGAAMFALTRMIGAAVGISTLQALTIRNSAAVHSRLVEGVRPDNPIMAIRQPGADFGLPGWIAQINGQIVREASMVGYVDTYFLLCLLTAATVPMAFLMRRAKSN